MNEGLMSPIDTAGTFRKVRWLNSSNSVKALKEGG